MGEARGSEEKKALIFCKVTVWQAFPALFARKTSPLNDFTYARKFFPTTHEAPLATASNHKDRKMTTSPSEHN